MTVLKFSPIPRLEREIEKLLRQHPEWAHYQVAIDRALDAAGDDSEARMIVLRDMLRANGAKLDEAIAELKAENKRMADATNKLKLLKPDINSKKN